MHYARRVTFVLGMLALALQTCRATPEPRRPMAVVTSQPKPGGPVPLTAAAPEAFLDWAAAATLEEKHLVDLEIEKAKGDPAIVPALWGRLDASQDDADEALLLLSIIGALRDSAFALRLEEYVWAPLPAATRQRDVGLSTRQIAEMLRSKAVQGLAYLRVPEADEQVTRIAASHPSSVIRAAAIDAYLWNHGDSLEAAKDLRLLISPDDAPLVDRVRWSRGAGRQELEKGLSRYYELHRGALPPAPAITAEMAHMPAVRRPRP